MPRAIGKAKVRTARRPAAARKGSGAASVRKAKASAAPAKRASSAKPSKPVVIKTRPTSASVTAFLDAVPDVQQRKDSLVLVDMMREATGEEPTMWGPSLIGFGNVRVKSPATGREVDWMRIGFSPRKSSLSLYLTGDIRNHAAALKKLGRHKTGKGCLYIQRLDDVDMKVLDGIIKDALRKGFFGT